LFFHNDQFPLE